REIDPACVAAPDLSTVRVVLQLEHPREIPRELRVYYRDGSASVVPVEIVGVWECSQIDFPHLTNTVPTLFLKKHCAK
uniref:Uncharacterized protein n=3 Tax=Aegilops tauschii TaxID=37682 RepID=A0A453M3R9_AEGTS